MVCRPITLSQKYGQNLLLPKTNLLENSVSFADILRREENPANRFEIQQLLETTQALNQIFPKIPLDNTPFLKNRVEQGPILYPEFADFLIQSGYEISTVEFAVKDFNAFAQTIFPTRNSSNPVIVPSNAIPSNITELNSELELYYSGNISNSISGGFCAAFSNAFGQILEVIAAIQIGRELLDKLLNFSIDDLIQNILEVKNRLIDIVEALFVKLKETIENLIDRIIATIDSTVQEVVGLYKRLHKKIVDLQQFFSDLTFDKIVDKIEDFIEGTTGQFEELTAESIALLMFRFCQFAELIQSFFKDPVDSVVSELNVLEDETERLESLQNENLSTAVRAGAVRLNEAGIREAQERQRKLSQQRRQNVVSGAIRRNPGVPIEVGPEPNIGIYVASPQLSAEENLLIQNLSDRGIPNRFKFQSNVLNMGSTVSDAQPGDGYKRVDPTVWQKLFNVSKRCNVEFRINSAYRSPQYNRLPSVGGAARSLHVTGKAIDVQMNGFSDGTIRNFIQAASEEGFGGMGIYFSGLAVSFIHIDIGRRRIWHGKSGGYGRFRSHILAHQADKFRKGETGS